MKKYIPVMVSVVAVLMLLLGWYSHTKHVTGTVQSMGESTAWCDSFGCSNPDVRYVVVNGETYAAYWPSDFEKISVGQSISFVAHGWRVPGLVPAFYSVVVEEP